MGFERERIAIAKETCWLITNSQIGFIKSKVILFLTTDLTKSGHGECTASTATI